MNQETLDKINKFTRKPLTEEEVYTFPVILCDNDIDRDYECFSNESLETLAEKFVGKTGIFDHNPTASNQNARIFDKIRKTVQVSESRRIYDTYRR